MIDYRDDPLHRIASIPIGRMTIEVLRGIPIADEIRKTGLIYYFHSREVNRIALQLAAVLHTDPEVIDLLRLCCEFNALLPFPNVIEQIIVRLKNNINIPSWNPSTRQIIIELLENKQNSQPQTHQLSNLACELEILWSNAQQLDFRYNPVYQQEFVTSAPIYRFYADYDESGIIFIGNSQPNLLKAFNLWIKDTQITRLYPEFKINIAQDSWWEQVLDSQQPVLCVGHFDAHGYSAAGVTYHSLANLGVDVELYVGYFKTGELSRFWKRTLNELLKTKLYEFIILHDLTIDSRHPSRTAAVLEQIMNYDCKVILCDHHQDTALYLPVLLEPNVRVYLSDAAGCQLPPILSLPERTFARAGAETDKEWHDVVPSFEEFRNVAHNKMEGWVNILSDFIKYPKLNASKIEEALALAAGKLAFEVEEFIDPELLTLPDNNQVKIENENDNAENTYSVTNSNHKVELKFEYQGRVVVFTERPPTSGRTWYQLMEDAMDTSKLEAGESDPYFLFLKCPYAIAFRLVNPKLYNILLLTHWGEPSAIPIGHFIPEGYTSVGYIAACWCDVPIDDFQNFLNAVINDINLTYPLTAS